MSIKATTYVSWKQLWETAATEAEIRSDLRRLGRIQTVDILAHIGILLFLDLFKRDAKETVALQRFFVAQLIDQEVQLKLRKKYGGYKIEECVCFHLQQVLTLLKWAIVEGNASQATDFEKDPVSRFLLGRCLLRTNDLLSSGGMGSLLNSNQAVKKCLAIQLSAGPTSEVNNPPPLINSVVRSDWVFGEILERLPTRATVSEAFQRRTGLELNAYIDMTIGVLSHFLSKDVQAFLSNPGQAILNPQTFFGGIPRETAARFWAKESASIEQLGAAINTPSDLQPHHDFVALRMKPFVQLKDTAVITANPGFVQEKLESGLFWAIANELDEEERKWLFDTWGALFQSYVNELLKSAIQPDVETHIPFPRFTRKGQSHESVDALVVSGERCALIECKGGFLKGSAKYSENETEFLADLDKKFGGLPRAGIEQLVRKITQIFHRKETQRRPVEGIDPEAIRFVIPVLIVQEPFVSSMFTTPWLAKRFRDLIRKSADQLRKKLIWSDLIVMHVEELEAIRPFLIAKSVSFLDSLSVVAARGQPGADNRIFTFWDVAQELLKTKEPPPRGKTDFDQRSKKVLDRVCMRFFGKVFQEISKEA